jgi:hypothetical protein
MLRNPQTQMSFRNPKLWTDDVQMSSPCPGLIPRQRSTNVSALTTGPDRHPAPSSTSMGIA